IEQVNVEENQVRICGFYPGSFPQGFLGYHAEQVDSTLYVSFQFSDLFGFFETGDFDITIPTNGKVTQVVIKTKNNEYPIWSEESSLSEGMEAPAVPTVFENILSQYRKILEENWNGQQLTDAGLNFMITGVSPETVGYSVDDLDDNGIPELAIGTISGDDVYGKLIFALYTVNKDGGPALIFSSTERDRYYYAGDNRFANLGSSYASDSSVTTLKLEVEGLVDMIFATDPAEYVQMELVPLAESKGEKIKR
ncbi:MAG: hypothetical protein ACI4IT_08025, partial [Oscillospiraceae bacterium]